MITGVVDVCNVLLVQPNLFKKVTSVLWFRWPVYLCRTPTRIYRLFLEILYLRCEEKPRFSEKCMLSRNAHYKEVNTKHPDFVLSSADTSIKVTVLPLTPANMHFLHGSKLKMLCATTTNFRIRALFLETPQL